MELKPFQLRASTQIAERFLEYLNAPLFVTATKRVPFYQNLSALTGSGKTVVLADAMEQIRSRLPVEPIVLWLSKGKVVVWQTYANLSAGKYASLLNGYRTKPLLECKQADIEQADRGLMLVATVGKFNQRDKEQSDRKVYQVDLDYADHSLWELLKKRETEDGKRRPFLIVYDEGHNLSNQQTELLLELEPDVILAASATTRIPEVLERIINRLKQDKGWKSSDLVTSIPSSAVVEAGLVKQHVLLGGYMTPMEAAVNDMFEQMEKLQGLAAQLELPIQPKAIYVSNTNLTSTGEKEDSMRPFQERTARPILIWRHLVGNLNVDPRDIAVYCNLKFHANYPPPANFRLFAGGEADYDTFSAGNYRHIIFNLSLQEGWDDPDCYLAYIDKDMGSKDQITQVIGRVLRQPGARHYPHPELNTAHFYIRTDEKSVFEEVLSEVKAQIAAESPDVSLIVYKSDSGKAAKPALAAKKTRFLPEISVNSAEAILPIRRITDNIHDYRNDPVNTVGRGSQIKVLQTIGRGEERRREWVEVEHSNLVTARWMFVRELQKYHWQAVHVCDIEDPKFDARIEHNSPAANRLRESAERVAQTYCEYSTVVQNHLAFWRVGDVVVDPRDRVDFKNALHDGYSTLNTLEKKFAFALDETGHDWMRNPAKGGLEIPLLDSGKTKSWNPDFIVWVDDLEIVAIDTKGDHLILEDSARKLFDLASFGEGPKLKVRLVTEGEWNSYVDKVGVHGYTVWGLKRGKVLPMYCHTLEEAVRVCSEVSY
ncbi:DEAD/DEAH box helicase family protein [Tumebacillus flagellatus]|uniref:Helicase/UvrB N-terminal domain-containing protein n=1 Tax=Tumebacillus flagellatus TaxID=1157490 RepID=A0A074M903_9BACL|nr:DEAD/DEAH box helicase family protein [Tumebacillus flagellatus]KEO82442.1 hypothetical protein EL26_15295 [Tumebacillus flagellatus]